MWQKKLLRNIGNKIQHIMEIGGLRLHGSARRYTLRRSQDRKAFAFAPAFLSCRPSPARLCSMLHSSPFPRQKSLCFRSGFSLLPAFAFTALLFSPLLPAFALHGSAFFAVASGVRLHGSARRYILRRSHPEKTSFFRDAGVRPIKRSVICLSKASFPRH